MGYGLEARYRLPILWVQQCHRAYSYVHLKEPQVVSSERSCRRLNKNRVNFSERAVEAIAQKINQAIRIRIRKFERDPELTKP
jgi:hypothetical protein